MMRPDPSSCEQDEGELNASGFFVWFSGGDSGA